jgi:hypothetical protein
MNIRDISIKCGNCDSYQTLTGFARREEWNVYTFECDHGRCEPAVTRTLVEVPRQIDDFARRDPELAWRRQTRRVRRTALQKSEQAPCRFAAKSGFLPLCYAFGAILRRYFQPILRQAEAVMKKTVVHVVGTGTIGEPLIGLFTDFREKMGIDEVTFHKRSPLAADRSKINHLMARGAKLAADSDQKDAFEKIGHTVSYETEEALSRATVVVDCTPAGNEMKEKYYNQLSGPKGFLAQGSEFGFGVPYARGINDEVLVPGRDRFIQIVSCNTHNITTLIKTLCDEGEGSTPWSAGRSSACGGRTTSRRPRTSLRRPRWASTTTPSSARITPMMRSTSSRRCIRSSTCSRAR